MRRYSNLAFPLPIVDTINSSAPTITVSSTSGYPAAPFLLAIERGTSNEEVMLCTAKTGTTFTVQRGYDGTTGVGHDAGTFVEHTTAAIDFRESGTVRITEAIRNALTGDELWEGRLIWNDDDNQLEVYDGASLGWVPLTPTGMIIPFAGSTLPPGWVWAQGQEINRTTYARLFAAIGTTWGSGNGSTTFNVPDLRRRFPLGRATSGGQTTLAEVGGTWSHTHTNPTSSSAGSHSHTNSSTGAAGDHTHTTTNAIVLGVTDPGLFRGAGTKDQHHHTTNYIGAHTHTLSSTGSTGSHSHTVGDTGSANPPYAIVNFIIKV